MNIAQIVLTELQTIVTEHTPFVIEVDELTLLEELHLESLAFTSLIVALETRIGFIPSPILQGMDFPESVGELIAMYEREKALS